MATARFPLHQAMVAIDRRVTSPDAKQSVVLLTDDDALASLIADVCGTSGLHVSREHRVDLLIKRVADSRHGIAVIDAATSGVPLVELLQQLTTRSHVAAIVIVERAEDRIAILDSGADECLTKPLDRAEFAARARALLRRVGAGGFARPLAVGRLTLEPVSRSARIDGRLVPLTSFEYDILEYLTRAAGRIVSREELMTMVCLREASALDRSLDVHISRVRRKLGSERGLIVTIRGTGYLLRSG